MTETNKRSNKRVATPRMAMIASDGTSHASYIEDISTGGALLHVVDLDQAQFAPGETVEVLIDEISPLTGRVIRIDPPIVAIEFSGLDEGPRAAGGRDHGPSGEVRPHRPGCGGGLGDNGRSTLVRLRDLR